MLPLLLLLTPPAAVQAEDYTFTTKNGMNLVRRFLRLLPMRFRSSADASKGNRCRSPIPGWRGARALLLAVALWENGLLSSLGQAGPLDVGSMPLPGRPSGSEVGHDLSSGNPVAAFMYFVPFISPEPVFCLTSPGSTQVARVLSAKRKSYHPFLRRKLRVRVHRRGLTTEHFRS